MAAYIHKRQNFDDCPADEVNCINNNGDFWFSSTGLIVRYAVVAALFGSIGLFILVSYLHARRRMKKGLEPKRYHRWLVRRTPRYAQTQPYYSSTGFSGHQMQDYPPPPPVYNQFDAPPTYQPPAGATKAMANQNAHAVGVEGRDGSGSGGMEYPPPAHPPPSHSITQ